MDYRLGDFGDARLSKGGRFFWSAWLVRAPGNCVCGDWADAGPERSG